jgi:hypothetical protein
LFCVAAVTLVVGLVACSSDGSSSAASSCAEAKKVADECNAKPKDGGASVTVNFDQGKCESGGDQAKKAADCIVQNKSNCDCILACSIQGSCSS